jgi:hypothetical protein
MLNPLSRAISPCHSGIPSTCQDRVADSPNLLLTPTQYRDAIRTSGYSIYDTIAQADSPLWLPSEIVESLLMERLSGMDVGDLPIRTKSKVVKTAVCEALGYPIPREFARVKPRFLGQMLDVHVQKGTNLQLYNSEDTTAGHRYALIEQQADGLLGRVRVIDRAEILRDATGTLTYKHQATLATGSTVAPLFGPRQDTTLLAEHVRAHVPITAWHSPTLEPKSGEIFSLSALEQRLSPLVGMVFSDPGIDQERKRGEAVHRLVCAKLGYLAFGDTGTFPDIKHQLLEIKLQTSRTIDLGRTLPNSEELLDLPGVGANKLRHCDARYAVFFADTDGKAVTITQLILTSGQDFFTVFRMCGGRVANEKIQISLGKSFFENSSPASTVKQSPKFSSPKGVLTNTAAAQQLTLW